MTPQPPRLSARRVLVTALLAIVPHVAAAQAPDPVTGSLNVEFKAASAYEDGYVHGRLRIDYAFRTCGGTVRLVYGVHPGSVEGFTTYWYKGHNYGVPEGTEPPATPALATELRVLFGAEVVYTAIKRDPYIATDLSCFGGSQFIGLGDVRKYDPNAHTAVQVHDVLNRFSFDAGITQAPLRSQSVESAFAREMAAARQKARQDSAATQRAARATRDSADRAARAARDSVARARAAAASTPRGGATPMASNGTRSTSPSNTPRTMSSADAAARRQAESEARARDEAAERARQASAVREMLAERQAEEEARTERVNAAASQLGSMVTDMLRANAAEQERRDAREFEALKRKWAYQEQARAIFARAPMQPRCSPSETRGRLTLDQPIGGALSLGDCRLADSTSAAIYTLDVDRTRPVTFLVQSAGFYGRVQVIGSTGVIGTTDGYKPMQHTLRPGTYRVVVSSEVPGETGTFTLRADRSAVSNTAGLALGLVMGGGTQAVTGVEGSMQQVGLRVGLGFGQYVTLFGEGTYGNNDGGADVESIEYGARLYFRGATAYWRPFLYGMTGTRKYTQMQSVSLDKYEGTATTFGTGIEWFLSRRVGVEAGLFHSGGNVAGPEPSTASRPLSTMGISTALTFHP